MVHNILEEGNVKENNYQLKIRGKENLNTVSGDAGPRKCDNSLKNASPNLFKEALVIKESKYD